MANAADLRAQVQRVNQLVFDEGNRMMMAELALAAPEGETGDTRRMLELIPGGAFPTLTALVRSGSPHGDYVENGTDPHDIEPRNGKALRFVAGSGRISTAAPNQRVATRGGGVVFAKVVHHPGTPPRPWFAPVVERWPEFLERAWLQAA